MTRVESTMFGRVGPANAWAGFPPLGGAISSRRAVMLLVRSDVADDFAVSLRLRQSIHAIGSRVAFKMATVGAKDNV